MNASLPNLDAVRDAAVRIAGAAHRTPVLRSQFFDQFSGASLFFKCENFQKVGAFKFRGAANAVLSLAEDDARRGVVTHSSGNHAQALALAARLRGIPATIVMPENAPAVKRAAVAGYGAEIVSCAPTVKAREQAAAEAVQRTGGVFIHPYNDRRIIAGQGTAALELLADVPELDFVLAPVGGGGLLSGTAIAARAEPARSRPWRRAHRRRRRRAIARRGAHHSRGQSTDNRRRPAHLAGRTDIRRYPGTGRGNHHRRRRGHAAGHAPDVGADEAHHRTLGRRARGRAGGKRRALRGLPRGHYPERRKRRSGRFGLDGLTLDKSPRRLAGPSREPFMPIRREHGSSRGQLHPPLTQAALVFNLLFG